MIWRLLHAKPWTVAPPGSSVHGILQARILESVSMPSSRGSSRHRNGTGVSCITGRFFTVWASREAHQVPKGSIDLTRLATSGLGCGLRASSLQKKQVLLGMLTYFFTVHNHGEEGRSPVPGTLLFLITWNMGGNWGKKTTKKINKNRRGANQKLRHEENPLTLRSCFLFSVSIDSLSSAMCSPVSPHLRLVC